MEIKDYITIAISALALLISVISLTVAVLSYRRNGTKLNVQQLSFAPSRFAVNARPNILYLDREQSPKLWTVVPMLYLVLYLKIDNLSYTGITITNLVLNDKMRVTKLNTVETGKDLSLYFQASEECYERDMQRYGCAEPITSTSLESSTYNTINIGDRIEPKSSIEGVIVISGNWNLYDAVNDGTNKLTIVTPDKQFDTYIEIDKTVIPNLASDEEEDDDE